MMALEVHALPVLLAQWARAVDRFERFVHALQSGASPAAGEVSEMHQELLDDLRVRHEISQRVRTRPATADSRSMLAELDEIFRSVTVEAAQCVAGADEARDAGWKPEREWYFWRELQLSGPASGVAQ